MAGHTPWRKIVGEVSPERRARIEKLKRQYEQEIALEELREALALTQQELARRLKTSQAHISQIERRADMLLSTLAKVIAAMGGRLELSAHFKSGTVRLKRLGRAAR